MKYDVSVVPCPDYSQENAASALQSLLAPLGGLDWVKPGMRIAIKVNLVTMLKPETAAVTHPVLVAELCRMLSDKGAQVVVGDSPGGPWSGAYLSAVYSITGMYAVEKAGAKLNRDFSQHEVSFPEAAMMKSFMYTSWLNEADTIIDFCKLKTHGLTAMSCAVKNMFGVIPGTRKPELHYLYPDVHDFSNMLVDLVEYTRPRLCIVDAVEAMEGNGPTQGTPRHVGALLASDSAGAADLACAHIIGLEAVDVPTLTAAADRGLCPRSHGELNISGDLESFVCPDFKTLPPRSARVTFTAPTLISRFLETSFGSSPKVMEGSCVVCSRCKEVCPAGAIDMEKSAARIDKKKCIRCFCCQEFCPKGAIVVHRPVLARVLGK